MPTYEYECSNCGYQFDKFQSMTEAVLERCPKCGRKKLSRLIGAGAGIIFKGSGFYATDYRKSDKKKIEEQKDSSPCSTCNPSSPNPNCPNADK